MNRSKLNYTCFIPPKGPDWERIRRSANFYGTEADIALSLLAILGRFHPTLLREQKGKSVGTLIDKSK